jgi:hypothetical protein
MPGAGNGAEDFRIAADNVPPQGNHFFGRTD